MFFRIGVSVVFCDMLNNIAKCNNNPKSLKKKKKKSLSCTAHLLTHLKEWYDYFSIVKFPESYESI